MFQSSFGTPEHNFTASGPTEITYKCTVRGNQTLAVEFGQAIDPSAYESFFFIYFLTKKKKKPK